MTSRRDFIKTVAVIPPGLFFERCWAANPDPSRLALIIGNSAYRDAPLVNPVNDARAFAHLCTEAGLTVDSHLNASRTDMMEAIERFGATVKRPGTRQAVFYYAGHGAQLDWRNYLLPVDAVVEKQDHMKQRCVDLNLLLGQLSAAKDKTFIVILDACRNNPFGISYRPEQKGLSQFDAPVGSLIAYSTAPGNVASDGTGENGLYTENLVRELSQRGTRIEDALKRVRLNVRLASHGEQIPWETTSLEGDVFLFNEGQKKLTEAELEKLVETDISEWARIKSSNKVDDWVGYLRTFPNGRFSEIAQMRLTRLLAESEKPRSSATSPASAAPGPVQALPATSASSPAQAAAPKPEPVAVSALTSDAPAIDIRAGVAMPTIIASSANPYSAGRYPLGRIFTLGDEATFRQTDILTGLEERTYTMRVTRVDYDEDRVEFNKGNSITDLMGNPIKNGAVQFNTPVQFAPAEFQIGKKWAAAFSRIEKGVTSNAYYDLQIVKRETISVPAGSFDTFRIEGEGWNTSFGNRLQERIWLVPGLNFLIRRESIGRGKGGGFFRTERYELVSLRQHNSIEPV
ncbi:MAG: caspase family protein [Propionivibrio sp.]|uniref:caspase family protein n=1 Tax=Propionivibrio sp. TaxID=2212460 RepID=UPI001A3D71C0|nr:caspase family protein [Propionivibrio sp.]MBL8414380.1 caspase family protein [Propionivibrio sp.]